MCMHAVFFLSLSDRMFLILTILKMKERCPCLMYMLKNDFQNILSVFWEQNEYA